MKILSSTILDLEDKTDIFFDLLLEEDFNFKTKNININFEKVDNNIKVNFDVNNILDLKIATNAVIKSLEIIDSTMKV